MFDPTLTISAFPDLNPRHLWALLQLRSEVFVTEQMCRFTDPDIQDPLSMHAFIENENQMLACGRAYFSTEWHIGRIAVRADQRGMGLGKQIIQSLLTDILSLNSNAVITISAQLYLIRYYRNLGFQPQHRMYLEDGIPHMRMLYQPNQTQSLNNPSITF